MLDSDFDISDIFDFLTDIFMISSRLRTVLFLILFSAVVGLIIYALQHYYG